MIIYLITPLRIRNNQRNYHAAWHRIMVFLLLNKHGGNSDGSIIAFPIASINEKFLIY